MSYDFEVYDSNSNVLFNSGTLALRETDVLEVQAGQAGTYAVPDFDDNKGVVFLNGMYGETTFNTSSFNDSEISYSWDNSSKILTYDVSDAGFGTFYFLFMSFK